MLLDKLSESKDFVLASNKTLKSLGKELNLPDGGENVKQLANKAPGSAFDPRDLEKFSELKIGYKIKWAVERYNYYGFDWDITGLCLNSRNPDAGNLPFLVIINGGSANFYEFFLDPLNEPGLGQYLAQRTNVLLITIPGNFKYGGWTEPPGRRVPRYLLDKDISIEEVRLRNAIYTNMVVFEGLKRLINNHTIGDILIVGHSTSGELAFLSIKDKDLKKRLKGRFLGWGSGGPSIIRKEWEESVGIRKNSIKSVSAYPPLWQLRTRGAKGYVSSGYIGPLNPCAESGMKEVEIAQRWLSLVERRRPNFKQVLQDIEHMGLVELQLKIELELSRIIAETKIPVKTEDIFKDMFASNNVPLTVYNKMVWVVAKWDKGHWHRENVEKSRELTIANQFRQLNPDAKIRILLLDVPMTHYGHIEMPKEVAGSLIAASQWLKS